MRRILGIYIILQGGASLSNTSIRKVVRVHPVGEERVGADAADLGEQKLLAAVLVVVVVALWLGHLLHVIVGSCTLVARRVLAGLLRARCTRYDRSDQICRTSGAERIAIYAHLRHPGQS